MKKNKENNTAVPADDEKIHISKSIFETNRDLQKKAAEEELQRQAELEKKLAERRKKAEEAREKRLEAERLELIRLKQGVIEESETIHEEAKEEIQLSPWKKITNFFYHSKWWLGIVGLFGVIAVYLLVNYLTRPNPDVIVLLIGENYKMAEESTLEDYIESFIDDYNDNGKVEASVYYIPYSGDNAADYANGALTKLSAEMQNDQAAIIIGNKMAAEMIGDEGVLMDISQIFPDNKHITKDKLMLKDTDFAEKIGLNKEDITDDWFIGIRAPRQLMHTSQKKMQELYDKDYPVFETIVEDLSE